MNVKIYKSVHDLAEQLMKAAHKEDNELFDCLYEELKQICINNENTDKDHPVQWETLADFTDDLEYALELYAKALEKSIVINVKDYMASIAFSMANLQIELGRIDVAIKNLKDAKVSANKIADKDLKNEIDELLKSLLEDKIVSR